MIDQTTNDDAMRKLMRLTPLAEKPITFLEFLNLLRQHTQHADCSAAVIYRAITAMGVEDPFDEPKPKRRQYLRMLRDLNIPSLNAFKHVAGSQRFVLQPLSFLLSAGAGGAQRQKMLIIDGGPACGKDYFKDGIIMALEAYTEAEKIYAVEGCNEHESPINLLRLLKPNQIEGLSQMLGINDLPKLVDMASEPCQRCYEKVMGTVTEPQEEPNFDKITVVPLRLSARSFGVSDWQPGGNVSLAAALRKGNRGFLSMPDAFIRRESRPGETDERMMLLDTVQYRRLPGEVDSSGHVSAASPLDVVILATTNKKALKLFLYGEPEQKIAAVVPDADAFSTRAAQMRLAYNTVRVEEVGVYEREFAKYKVSTTIDPLVLEVLATVAVLSRLTKPRKKVKFVHPLDIVALYEGEQFEANLRPESEFDAVWGTISGAENKEVIPTIPDGIPISAGLLFQFADPEEGTNGLDMRTMLGLISSINQMGLKQKGEMNCVNSLEVIGLMRDFMAAKVKAKSNNTPEQQAVYERMLKWLGGGTPVPGATPPDKPEIVEAEYRRLLRALLLRVFSPDYEQRAQKLFNDYRLHAPAAFEGKQTVRDPQVGQVPVNTGLIDELDHYRLNKDKGSYLSESDKAFRGRLDALIGIIRDQYVEEHGQEAAKDFKLTWESIAELGKAIRGKLDFEIGSQIEKLITTEVKSDLNAFELEQLQQAERAMAELGFCPSCQKPVLEYAKRTKVWSFKLY